MKNPTVTVEGPKDIPMYGVYVCFGDKVTPWKVEAKHGGDWVTVYESEGLYAHEFAPLEGETASRVMPNTTKQTTKTAHTTQGTKTATSHLGIINITFGLLYDNWAFLCQCLFEIVEHLLTDLLEECNVEMWALIFLHDTVLNVNNWAYGHIITAYYAIFVYYLAFLSADTEIKPILFLHII